MHLAATAPRYGWTDLAYTLVPNGMHSELPGIANMPAFNGCSTGPLTTAAPPTACPPPQAPMGIPKQSILSILYVSGTTPSGDHTTFAPAVAQAFTCLNGTYPLPPAGPCDSTRDVILPEYMRERGAYYQNQFFTNVINDIPGWRVPVFNAGTLTDPLFPAYENRRMANRLLASFAGYPIKQYYGDYQHFVQNKAKEWGDLCTTPSRHVCTLAAGDYSASTHAAVNAGPTDAVSPPAGIGVTTRLNKFIDAAIGSTTLPQGYVPSGSDTTPDVTASLQICPQNATGGQAADEAGERFTASSFEALTTGALHLDFTGSPTLSTTTSDVVANPHADNADPVGNFLLTQGKCPVETQTAGPGVASFTSDPLTAAATMIGATKVEIDFTATGDTTSMQLNARLYDVLPSGTAVMVDRGPRRLSTLEATGGHVEYELHGNGWKFPIGDRVRIEITQDDEPFVKHSDPASAATLTQVQLDIPTREGSLSGGGNPDPKPTATTPPSSGGGAATTPKKKCKKGFKLKKGKCKRKRRRGK
jgi:hypothetical protein